MGMMKKIKMMKRTKKRRLVVVVSQVKGLFG
jgi:hypothetical protein